MRYIDLARLIFLVVMGFSVPVDILLASDDLKQLMKEGLRSKGPVEVEKVLMQDEIQKYCSSAVLDLGSSAAADLMERQLKAVVFPENENFIGNWREGERIAQSGKGMRFNDSVNTPRGGNCYACHKIRKGELSHGTLGPSLYQYGKLRGYSEEVIRYTWIKIYNAQALALCSNMPRYGHNGILTVEQMQDVMALLLDPNSPVNQ